MPLPPSPELATLQRALSHLYIECPESIAREVEHAFNAFLGKLNSPVDLATHCHCVRCGGIITWPESHMAQIGVTLDDHKLVRPLCRECYNKVDSTLHR